MFILNLYRSVKRHPTAMRKTRHYFVTAPSLAVAFLCQAPAWGNDYFSNLMGIIEPRHSQVALSATDLTTGELIYQQNADTLLLPASTQKLLTAVAATAQLGNGFKFDTQVFSHFPIRHGKIAGDIYITFSGDPTLTTDNLRDLFKQLTDQGLYEVSGNIYLVGEPGEQTKAPGWVWDDLGICYAAPVSAFVINQNCIHGQLRPKMASNESQLSFASYLPVSLSTSAVFDKRKQGSFCELELSLLANNTFHLSGCHAGDKPINLAIAINDPALFASKMIEQLLKSSQIRVKGKVKVSSKRAKYHKVIASHSSEALPALVETMLLKSDNLIADSLFKAIGKSYFGEPANFSHGAKAVELILTAAGVDLSHSQIVDGSGLSRYNLLTANQLSQVLMLIYEDKRFQGLIEQLPVAGISGTLRYKAHYNRAPLKQRVVAKTGSMQGVDNLAGFISLNQTGKALFVVLENGQSPKTKHDQIAPFSALFLQTLLDSAPLSAKEEPPLDTPIHQNESVKRQTEAK